MDCQEQRRTGSVSGRMALSLGLLGFFGWICCSPSADSKPNEEPAEPVSVVLDSSKQALLDAYPDFVSHFEGDSLVWKDGSKMIWDDGKEKVGEERFDQADLEDMFSQPYPAGAVVFQPDFDPGRARPEAFFKKMYGGNPQEVTANLIPVNWLGENLMFNKQNGAADALQKVADEIALHPTWKEFATPSSGTYNWRTVDGTERLSNHCFGIAIDLNIKHANYWRWWVKSRPNEPLKQRNFYPKELIKVFERHGFIWGGKWYHYDTMHFEFRPEQCRACQEK